MMNIDAICAYMSEILDEIYGETADILQKGKYGQQMTEFVRLRSALLRGEPSPELKRFAQLAFALTETRLRTASLCGIAAGMRIARVLERHDEQAILDLCDIEAAFEADL